MKRLPCWAFLLAGLPVLASPGAAEPPARPAPAAEEAPVFGEVIDVRVVNVEVVVTDRSGDRVTGLSRGDFRLEVDGREVPVTFFTEVREGVSAAAAAGAAEPAGPVEPGSPVGTSYLVFVDDYFSTDIRRNEVLQSLKGELSRLGPEDRMAIVAWDGGRLSLLSSWSGSPNQLARALDTAIGRPTRGLELAIEQGHFESDRSFGSQDLADGRPVDLNVTDVGLTEQERAYGSTLSRRIEGAVSASVSTLRAFASPPGRKVMLLLSGGWPFSIQSYLRPGGFASSSRQVREGEDLLRPLTSTANPRPVEEGGSLDDAGERAPLRQPAGSRVHAAPGRHSGPMTR